MQWNTIEQCKNDKSQMILIKKKKKNRDARVPSI